jgi:outer membrane receptor protein involved in Fe transport
MDKIPMFGIGMAQIRAEYVYRDKIYFTFQNQPDRLENSIGLFNLSARLTSNDGRWSAFFAGRNLADKKYVANIIATPAGQFVVPAEGRTWQLGGTLSF